MSRIDGMVDLEANDFVSDLRSLIRQPSVSSKRQGLEECARLVREIMRKGGIPSELLYLKDGHAAPVVYGEVRSKSNPNAKTLLFYNHYDVQPVEPVSQWEEDPFGGVTKDGKIFGRGAADDKGELITRIKTVEYYVRHTGDVPCNVKFLVEGEEEVGSPNLERYVRELRDRCRCDGIIWELGYVDANDVPIINLGMKGMLYVELVSSGPLRDIHSSFAAVVENPAWRLVEALGSIWDGKDAKVLVRGWDEEVRGFTAAELRFMNGQPLFDESTFKKKHGISRFLKGMEGIQVQRALAGSPTCNISGLLAGHLGSGAKTILPSSAEAKLDFRLVPDMSPEKQFERLRSHLKERGFSDIRARFVHGISPHRTDHEDPLVARVRESAKAAFGKTPTVNLSSAGTGPMSLMAKALKAPCVAVGSTSLFANIHSTNEFARIDLLSKGIKCIGNVMERLSGA